MNQSSSRPGSVTAAEGLLWLSAAIAAVFTIAAYVGLLPFRITANAAFSNLITVALLALCAVKIGAGRNWARWLMLVVFVLGSLLLPLALIFAPQVLRSMPTLLVVVGFIQTVIQLAALILVFMPASKSWFRPTAQAGRNEAL